jgi:hypothetical protein
MVVVTIVRNCPVVWGMGKHMGLVNSPSSLLYWFWATVN